MEQSTVLSEAGITKEDIKEMLIIKRGNFERELKRVTKAFKQELKSVGTVKSDNTGDFCTGPSINGSRIKNFEKCLRKFDKALKMADDGTYGICTKCQEPIPLARLKLVPFTSQCVSCKEGNSQFVSQSIFV